MENDSINSNEEEVEEEEELHNVFNRRASLNATSMEQDYYKSRGSDGRPGNIPSTPVQTFVQKRRIVSDELTKYFSPEGGEAFLDPVYFLHLPLWIKKWGNMFPNVVRCMAAFFGVSSSSAGIELDFYFESLLLTKQRMSMRGEVSEMMHMVDRNSRFIDLSQVRTKWIRAARTIKIFCR